MFFENFRLLFKCKCILFQVTVGLEVLDKMHEDLNRRFGKDQLDIGKLLVLSPELFATKSVKEIKQSLSGALKHFNKVLDFQI